MVRNKLFSVLAFVIISLFSFFLIQFVAFEGLSSLENDSVSYLIMAQVFSPFVPADDLVEQAFLLEHYPPLFPFILAISHTVYHWYWAHILVALFFSLASLWFYLWTKAILKNQLMALFTLLLLWLLPIIWLNSLGILSESLYIFLTLLFFLLWQKQENQPPNFIIIFLIKYIIISYYINPFHRYCFSACLFYLLYSSIYKR